MHVFCCEKFHINHLRSKSNFLSSIAANLSNIELNTNLRNILILGFNQCSTRKNIPIALIPYCILEVILLVLCHPKHESSINADLRLIPQFSSVTTGQCGCQTSRIERENPEFKKTLPTPKLRRFLPDYHNLQVFGQKFSHSQ